jgi:hypothetical protein
MPGELTSLLFKALRSLTPEERDQVMVELLDDRLQPAPPAAPSPAPLPPPAFPNVLDPGQHVAELRQRLTLEAAGPWQTVPVRLPVELHERLRQWCQINNFTMAVVLRGLVARFLDQYSAPTPGRAGQTGTQTAPVAGDQPRR